MTPEEMLERLGLDREEGVGFCPEVQREGESAWLTIAWHGKRVKLSYLSPQRLKVLNAQIAKVMLAGD